MILSIYFGYHDSSITIADNQRVLLHFEAERFYNKKHVRFNSLEDLEKLVRSGLEYCNITIEDISQLLVSKWNNLFPNNEVVSLCGKEFQPTLTSHHNNHVGGVLRPDLDDCLIVCADGGSEDGFSKIFHRKNNQISLVEDLDDTILTGKFYGTIAQMVIEPKCSKAHNHDAGKLMGLAALGEYDENLHNLILKHQNEINKLHFDGCDHLREAFGLSDNFDEPWNDSLRCNLAFTAQRHWVESFYNKIKSHADKAANIALTGGCALNVVLNSKIASSGLFKETYTSPASNDSGQSIGAIMYHYPDIAVEYPYVGRSYGEIHNLPKTLPEDLIDNKIIAWYQGAAEIGPRALGNRSFIGLPTTLDLRDRLSVDIKKREPYRPVAPIIPLECVGDYFEETFNSPYMTFNYTAKEITKKVAPAIVHYDGTSRVQTITKEQNPVIYSLLKNLEGRGIPPIIMNSSFNIAGLPIADTPDDAIEQFKLSGADVLYINGARYTQDELS